MPNLYNQPHSVRFGTELLRQIDLQNRIEPFWDSLDVAVAWARGSGVAYLADSLTRFLEHGGRLRFTVGIDLQNTSREGLQALLDLESCGCCETFVYHNEAGSVFHPKLFLFRNEEEARLIIGSSNLTAAGLYTNVEAGIQLDASPEDDVILDALDALASWRDVSTKLSTRLDEGFLERLHAEGYVNDEADRSPPRDRRKWGSGDDPASKLFGSRPYSMPPHGTRSPAVTLASPSLPDAVGSVVIMRLRRSRSTQTQIPFRLAETFFADVGEVVSVVSGDVHVLNPAQARGNRNTIKLEIPELRGHADSFARFEKSDSGVNYEVHDDGTPQGNQIRASLEEGMATGATQTSMSDVAHATWWRYI